MSDVGRPSHRPREGVSWMQQEYDILIGTYRAARLGVPYDAHADLVRFYGAEAAPKARVETYLASRQVREAVAGYLRSLDEEDEGQ